MSVMNSVRSVMNGADLKDLWRGGGLIVALAALVVIINTLTTWLEASDTALWEPVVWEVTSLLALALALWIPWLTSAMAPADEVLAAGWGPKLHFVIVHGLGVLAYAGLHVMTFVLLRMLIYAALGSGYDYDGAFWFEFRKDMLSYMLFLSMFWAVAQIRRNSQDVVRPVSFDIRDGARIIRVPVSTIQAVRAAGNYVEFVLEDGRKPLMRATLSAVEGQLSAVGFVRTHRSYLINPHHVTGLDPTGSGDWNIRVGQIEMPLSRRYPQALEQLRG